MPKECRVRFSTDHPALNLPAMTELSRVLTVENSPVLFGCRTGLCATCASIVEVEGGAVAGPDEEELETLELACENEPRARLLCQLKLTGDIKITPLDRDSK